MDGYVTIPKRTIRPGWPIKVSRHRLMTEDELREKMTVKAKKENAHLKYESQSAVAAGKVNGKIGGVRAAETKKNRKQAIAHRATVETHNAIKRRSLTTREIATVTGHSLQTVQRAVRRLQAAGMATTAGEERTETGNWVKKWVAK